MTPGTNWEPSDDFLTRVRNSYQAAGAPDGDYPWAWIDRRRQPVHEALIATDNRALRAIFSDPASTDLLYGADNLYPEVLAQIDADPDSDTYAAQALRSDLLLLLDAIGAQRIPYDGNSATGRESSICPPPFPRSTRH
jgi:hypothetical protein